MFCFFRLCHWCTVSRHLRFKKSFLKYLINLENSNSKKLCAIKRFSPIFNLQRVGCTCSVHLWELTCQNMLSHYFRLKKVLFSLLKNMLFLGCKIANKIKNKMKLSHLWWRKSSCSVSVWAASRTECLS